MPAILPLFISMSLLIYTIGLLVFLQKGHYDRTTNIQLVYLRRPVDSNPRARSKKELILIIVSISVVFAVFLGRAVCLMFRPVTGGVYINGSAFLTFAFSIPDSGMQIFVFVCFCVCVCVFFFFFFN